MNWWRWLAILPRAEKAPVNADAAAGGPTGTATPDQLAAINEERARIYQDLHDDIGAKLVTIFNAAGEEPIRELARTALQDLREVVYHARGEPGTLAQVLGEIRGELALRLQLVGWELQWEEETLPEVLLPGHCTIHIYRILREATTNAIKHSAAGVLRVRARHERDMIYLDVTDRGDAPEPLDSRGSGIKGMRDRAALIGGQLDLQRGTLHGVKVILRFPIPSS
jgi:signal transduction histidine kinase